ncbi:hypothetical protein BDV26DRAFT_298261 [Aspergillus bertholletiae]|uniref:Uncharacterized protein n=1 Tax=Aspergillus bertholletiae TaxID=1226010 RepID=A0A5N7AQ81_9EURO|nr:hypothetical protein BDV26DRAFT_298261 [Aspergillus bertholletiae]
MAPLLAPYNRSMRLGSGFNFYTQQLCINDAVIRREDNIIATQSSETEEVAQSVIWKTAMIDKTSDITDALNVFLTRITNVHPVNSNKIKTADINSLINVKVINETVTDAQLTEFDPIPDAVGNDPFDFYPALGYENAGIYTASLLEDYLEYKNTWKLIQSMSEEISHRPSAFQKRPGDPDMSEEIKKSGTQYKPDTKNEPKQLWELSTYDATLVGLEKAQRDCRLRMIDIVEAIAEDPTIALDLDRSNCLLSPILFRQLLPVYLPSALELHDESEPSETDIGSGIWPIQCPLYLSSGDCLSLQRSLISKYWDVYLESDGTYTTKARSDLVPDGLLAAEENDEEDDDGCELFTPGFENEQSPNTNWVVKAHSHGKDYYRFLLRDQV